jgi:hypothetical protein
MESSLLQQHAIFRHLFIVHLETLPRKFQVVLKRQSITSIFLGLGLHSFAQFSQESTGEISANWFVVFAPSYSGKLLATSSKTPTFF